MSLLKEMLLLSPKVEHIESSMDLDSYLLSQDSVPVDVQPVSPDVLANGAEDLLFDGTVFSTGSTVDTKDLLSELEQIGQPDQASLLDDFLDGPVDLHAFLHSLGEPGAPEPEVPSAFADLSSFDVDSILGLRHESMEAESDDSGIVSLAAAASPGLPDNVSPLPTGYESSSLSPAENFETVIEEQPGMYVELVSDCGSPQDQVSSVTLLGSSLSPARGLVMVKCEPGISDVSSKSGARFDPCRRPSAKADRGESKKERKRLQNQQAAIRYRQKKKQECDTLQDQAAVLHKENAGLSDKVDGLEKEIKYMKDLLLEVYKAKGLVREARKLEHALRD